MEWKKAVLVVVPQSVGQLLKFLLLSVVFFRFLKVLYPVGQFPNIVSIEDRISLHNRYLYVKGLLN